MKRMIRILLVSLMLLLPITSLKADGEHVFFNDYRSYMSDDQYRTLNEDLQQIENNYDISIYFVFDTNIENSDTKLVSYAQDFLKSHSVSTNNVVLALNESYYDLEASGPQASLILNNATSIWNQFYNEASKISQSNPNAFYYGIVAYYQRVVKLINDELGTYQENTTSVNGDPVQDLANVLSDSEEADLNKRLQKISEKYNIDAVVLTTTTYNGKNAQAYADDIYDYNGYKDDGIIFVLNTSDRSWHVSTKGKAIDYFTDYGIDQIFEEMRPALANNQYYDAFVTYSNEVSTYIQNGNSGNIVDVDNPDGGRSFGAANLGISAIIAAIVSFFTNLSLKAQLKSVHRQHFANNYIVNNSFYLTGASDMLVNRSVSRMRRPRNDSGGSRPISSGGGGGSHIHTSSSGSTHGGHGGHF